MRRHASSADFQARAVKFHKVEKRDRDDLRNDLDLANA
jgi:hypothetical protein